MVYDSLEHFSEYVKLHPRFRDAEVFLRKLLSIQNLQTGRYEWDTEKPNEIFANVQIYKSKPFDAGVFETHKKYIDLQYVMSGEESLYLPNATTTSLVQRTPYQEKSDYSLQEILPQEDCTKLLLREGCFAILFPGEPHAPCLETEKGSCEVKKIVIKIRYECC